MCLSECRNYIQHFNSKNYKSVFLKYYVPTITLPLHKNKGSLTLCTLFCHLRIVLFFFFFFVCLFFKLTFSKKIFQEYHQSVKQFGSRSGPTFCRAWYGSKLFAKVIRRQQKSPLAGKELNPNLKRGINSQKKKLSFKKKSTKWSPQPSLKYWDILCIVVLFLFVFFFVFLSFFLKKRHDS